MKKLIAKIALSVAIVGMLFTGSLAHATTPMKAVVIDVRAGTGEGGLDFDVDYIDPTMNQVVGTYTDALYFGSDITAYTPSEIASGIQTKLIAYAVTQSWTVSPSDIISAEPVPFTSAQVASLNTVKSSTYQALVTQSGTSAPSANQYVNDFTGTTFAWARTGTGTYTLTASSPVFTSNKTAVIMSNPPNFLNNYKYTVTSSTVITVQTATLSVLSLLLTAGNADSILANTMVYVIVYP